MVPDDIATRAFDRAERHRQAARKLHEDNPDGLTEEQAAEFQTEFQAAQTAHQQGLALADLAEQADEGDRRAEVIQDLHGMANTGEIPGQPTEQQAVEQRLNHGELLLQMGRAQSPGAVPEGFDIDLRQTSRFLAHTRQGGNARDWVEQNLRVGTPGAGGNVVPTEISTTFVDVLERITGVLNAGAERVITDGGNPIELPTMGEGGTGFQPTEGTVGAYNAEGAAGSAVNLETGVVRLDAYKRFGLTNISYEAMEDTAPDIQSRIGGFLARWVGRRFNNDTIWGDGNNQPVGVLNAPVAGRTATAAGATFAAGEWTDILGAMGLVDDYDGTEEMSGWLMRKGTFYAIQAITDGDQRPIFPMVPQLDPVKRLFGSEVTYATYMPALAANAYVGVYANWGEAYIVRMVNNIRIERSLEHGFDTDLIYYRAILRYDADWTNKQLAAWLRMGS